MTEKKIEKKWLKCFLNKIGKENENVYIRLQKCVLRERLNAAMYVFETFAFLYTTAKFKVLIDENT